MNTGSRLLGSQKPECIRTIRSLQALQTLHQGSATSGPWTEAGPQGASDQPPNLSLKLAKKRPPKNGRCNGGDGSMGMGATAAGWQHQPAPGLKKIPTTMRAAAPMPAWGSEQWQQGWQRPLNLPQALKKWPLKKWSP